MMKSFKVDLHVHSRSSGDNDSDPEEVIERALEVGIDGIAFTEHYYYGASEEVELLRDKYRGRIQILRGVEFSAREGHCLVFGVNTDSIVEKHAPIERLIEIVNNRGGIVVPSHPFRGINSIGDRLFGLKGLKALEGFNGCNMQLYNNKALEVAKLMGLAFTGGSDAHRPSDTGSCYTLFRELVDEDNLVRLLKLGEYVGVDARKFARPYHILS